MSLQSRLAPLIAAIGADVKALQADPGNDSFLNKTFLAINPIDVAGNFRNHPDSIQTYVLPKTGKYVLTLTDMLSHAATYNWEETQWIISGTATRLDIGGTFDAWMASSGVDGNRCESHVALFSGTVGQTITFYPRCRMSAANNNTVHQFAWNASVELVTARVGPQGTPGIPGPPAGANPDYFFSLIKSTTQNITSTGAVRIAFSSADSAGYTAGFSDANDWMVAPDTGWWDISGGAHFSSVAATPAYLYLEVIPAAGGASVYHILDNRKETDPANLAPFMFGRKSVYLNAGDKVALATQWNSTNSNAMAVNPSSGLGTCLQGRRLNGKGEQGIQGEKGDQGPPGEMHFVGGWSGIGFVHPVGEVIVYNGVPYVCIVETQYEPPGNPAYWKRLVEFPGPWLTFAYATNWRRNSDQATYEVQYRQEMGGVRLRGIVERINSAATWPSVIGTLPNGFRPEKHFYAHVMCWGPSPGFNMTLIYISTTGDVRIEGQALKGDSTTVVAGAGMTFYLDNIFIPQVS